MGVQPSVDFEPNIFSNSIGQPRLRLAFTGVSFVAAFAVYYLTAYRTITWWNNSEEVLAAHDLGVMSAPGGVIPTILGWAIVHLLPVTTEVFVLNLFAGVLAGLVVAGVVVLGFQIAAPAPADPIEPRNFGSLFVGLSAAGAGFSLGFGETLWYYAVQYTTYIVTPAFTVMILFAMWKWWRAVGAADGLRWLFVAMLLFGLDISVHRTNALLLPGMAAWVAIGRPRIFVMWRAWVAAAAGLSLGLSFHAVVMLMAASDPFMNIGDPSTLARFWDYFSLKMRGGGFLLSLYPRNADFWTVQAGDWLSAFGRTFAATDGPLGVVGLVPLLAGVAGFVVVIRRSPRFGLAIGALFVLTVVSSIVYFNIPENYFRSLHRHYLPSLVIFGVLVVVGAIGVVRSLVSRGGPVGRIGGVAAVLLVLTSPCNQVGLYYNAIDGSGRTFARDYAASMLAGIEPNGILLTMGDNDTFPLWYLQSVEGIRPDVTVLNIPLLNTGWFVRQWRDRDPGLKLDFTDEELDQIPVVPWQDSVVTVKLAADVSDMGAITPPETRQIQIQISPTISNGYLMPQDYVVLRLVQNLQWERPLYTVAALGTNQLPWLQPFLRPEGLISRALPMRNPPIDVSLLERNLNEVYAIRGFDDPSLPIEPPTMWHAQVLYGAFSTLISAHLGEGDVEGARRACDRMFDLLPLDHTRIPPENAAALQSLCEMADPPTSSQ